MKRPVLTLCFSMLLTSVAFSQQTADSDAATKEDVDRAFQAMNLRDTMKTMMDAMMKQQRQLMHEQLVKTAATTTLPPDFEPRMNKMIDDLMKNFPFEEMIQAMMPVYQKHLNKGDINAMVAFYSTPTGQKLIRELPAITQEAMQAAYPIMQKQMTEGMERVQQEVAQMLKDAKPKSDPVPPAN